MHSTYVIAEKLETVLVTTFQFSMAASSCGRTFLPVGGLSFVPLRRRYFTTTVPV
jgi:hypothetical protein